uniref:Embryo-specific protein 3 n=1 Tax=Picea sitchensis TaxID=3332 RepID=A9NMX6_PICSI|nr:unknown [Picea sitchensis]
MIFSSMSGPGDQKVRATLAFILLLLLAVPIWARPPLATMLPGQQKGNCSYAVEIETTCAPSAETADQVGVRFGDPLGNHVVAAHLKHPAPVFNPGLGHQKQGGTHVQYKAFDRCAIDRFEVEGPCMQRGICYLYLKRVGADDWRPGWAKVLCKHKDGLLAPASDMFYFRTFLPSNVWFGFDYCDTDGPHPPLLVHDQAN